MTKKGNKRFNSHVTLANKNPQLLIQKKIRDYGKENFIFEIIFQTKDLEYCRSMESHFISENKTLVPTGYNIHSGGNYHVIDKRDSSRKRMLMNNPGNTEESLKKKTSLILAKNIITGQSFFVANRLKFAEDNGLHYSSIGWAIQNKKPLKDEWFFSYVKKRTMGV